MNNVLTTIRFKSGTSVGLLEDDPEGGSLGMLFALNGGRVVSPAAPPMYMALFEAFRKVIHLPGTIGVRHGLVSQHPVFSSSVTVRTRVCVALRVRYHRQPMQLAMMDRNPLSVTLEGVGEKLVATVLQQTGERGFGLFAAQRIRKGDLVATYGGIVMPDDTMTDQSNTMKLYARASSGYVRTTYTSNVTTGR